MVDAVPAVVVDQRFEFFEAHALVTQRESARAHVLEHDLHRLGRVHDGFETEADRVESELLEFLGREDGSAPADQRIGELRYGETARATRSRSSTLSGASTEVASGPAR